MNTYFTTRQVADHLDMDVRTVLARAARRRAHGIDCGLQQEFSGNWLWTLGDMATLTRPLPGRWAQHKLNTTRP